MYVSSTLVTKKPKPSSPSKRAKDSLRAHSLFVILRCFRSMERLLQTLSSFYVRHHIHVPIVLDKWYEFGQFTRRKRFCPQWCKWGHNLPMFVPLLGHAVIKAKDHISSLKLGSYVCMDVWTSVGSVHTR